MYGIINMIMITALVLFAGCKNATQKSDSKGVMPVAALDETAVIRPNEVLIYYANESAARGAELQNLNQMIQLLSAPEYSAISPSVKKLGDDAAVFQKIVDEEIALLAQLCQAGKSVFVITNRLLRGDHGGSSVLKCINGESTLSTVKVEASFSELKKKYPEISSHVSYQNHPLANPYVFEWVLHEVVAKLFNPETYGRVLITKSHGSVDFAIIPRIAVSLETVKKDLPRIYSDTLEQMKLQEAARVEADKIRQVHNSLIASKDTEKNTTNTPFLSLGANILNSLAEGLQKGLVKGLVKGLEKSLVKGLEKSLVKGLEKSLNKGLEKSLVKGLEKSLSSGYEHPEFGVSKEQYFEVLFDNAAEQKQVFPIVFLESCSSYLNDEVQSALVSFKHNQGTIGTVFSSDAYGLEYKTINYQRIIDKVKSDPKVSLSKLIGAELKAIGDHEKFLADYITFLKSRLH